MPKRCRLSFAFLLALWPSGPVLAAPLGAGFTYQGELMENGAPVTGTPNLRFSLWNAAGSGSPPVGGSQIGGSQTLAGVPTADGIFTVLLNDAGQFGAAAFNGDPRWLQVEVCNDPACASFTTLGPRHPVTAAPYARFSAAPWETNAGNTVLPAGSVGIGTVAPEAALHLVHADVLAGANDSEWMFHTRSHANGDFLHITDLDGGVPQFQRGLIVNQTGNIGVGTSAPAAALDVRGDVKLGTTGQYWAPGSDEKLRVMRGEVLADGSAPLGCCFSCVRVSTGQYVVTYANPFQTSCSAVVTPTTAGVLATIWTSGPTSFVVFLHAGTTLTNSGFQFIAAGPR